VEIQRLTWGERFTEVVPATILQICQKVGGVAAGAFDAGDGMLGFVFGLTGVRSGRVVHWSHMLAVRPEARGLGLGKRLKVYQREALLAVGVTEVRWTFDPLVAQNANLNLNALGADIESYVPEMYGSHTGSDLHSGLGTDRLVALWKIADPKVPRAIGGALPAPAPKLVESPVVNVGASGRPVTKGGKFPSVPAVRIEVPADIQQVKATALKIARVWRSSTRQAFLWYLERAYRVAGFVHSGPGGRCYYLLERDG
jgi:predicted GNAT superfamily acetyltransferase